MFGTKHTVTHTHPLLLRSNQRHGKAKTIVNSLSVVVCRHLRCCCCCCNIWRWSKLCCCCIVSSLCSLLQPAAPRATSDENNAWMCNLTNRTWKFTVKNWSGHWIYQRTTLAANDNLWGRAATRPGFGMAPPRHGGGAAAQQAHEKLGEPGRNNLMNFRSASTVALWVQVGRWLIIFMIR